MDPESESSSIRSMIRRLTALAGQLPEGEDSELKFGVCDKTGTQVVNRIEVVPIAFVPTDGRASGGRSFGMIKGHIHPGEDNGEYWPGITANVDDEYRKLLGEDDDGNS